MTTAAPEGFAARLIRAVAARESQIVLGLDPDPGAAVAGGARRGARRAARAADRAAAASPRTAAR